ncbi:MAG: RloB family protein [Saprospiraceae bacterium]|nr:RloB family protein [Saprospiraceae bacterium]MDP5047181.1 RloB family protein [Saprospiraceae bacterium]
MSRNKRIPKGKVINPTFYVFCEGETEEAYINYLRSKYRLPILIDAK